MNLEVVGHRVLIKPEVEAEKTEWGFEMGGDTFERERGATQVGKVISIGPNAWLDFKSINKEGKLVPGKPWAIVGDRVYYAKYAGKDVTIEDEKYIIVNDEDIQCVLRGGE